MCTVCACVNYMFDIVDTGIATRPYLRQYSLTAMSSTEETACQNLCGLGCNRTSNLRVTTGITRFKLGKYSL